MQEEIILEVLSIRQSPPLYRGAEQGMSRISRTACWGQNHSIQILTAGSCLYLQVLQMGFFGFGAYSV